MDNAFSSAGGKRSKRKPYSFCFFQKLFQKLSFSTRVDERTFLDRTFIFFTVPSTQIDAKRDKSGLKRTYALVRCYASLEKNIFRHKVDCCGSFARSGTYPRNLSPLSQHGLKVIRTLLRIASGKTVLIKLGIKKALRNKITSTTTIVK